jgi:hypothetical protein
LPAISRGELQVDVYNRSGVCKPHQKESTAVASGLGKCQDAQSGKGEVDN